MPLEKIDLHSHFLPPFFREALLENGHEHPDGMPAPPAWSEEAHLTFHQELNVTKSILSISTPGTHLTPGQDAKARDLTRRVNEYASDLKKRKPKEFGFFASLPLPDVEGALEEIAYADDQLNADGFTLLTNHHGIYVGDKKFDPIFDELNKRHATVFIHPTTPCTAHEGGGCSPAIPLGPGYPRPLFEFFFDSARAYTNLFLGGTISRCPNIKFVMTHAAGVFPSLIDRVSSAPGLLKLPGMDLTVTPAFMKERLNSEQFWFDTAGWAFPHQIQGLLAYLEDEQRTKRIVYGSDFPWTPFGGVKLLSEAHDENLGTFFPGAEQNIGTKNAERLLSLRRS